MLPAFSADLRVITFDLGGTLIAPTPSVGEIYAEILADHGIDANPGELNRRFPDALRKWTHALRPRLNPRDERGVWRQIVQDTLGPLTPQEARFGPLFDDLFDAFASGRRWQILPEVPGVLAELTSQGLRLAVLSNSDSRMRAVLRDLQLERYFEAIFLSSEIGFEKPDPRLFAHIARTLECPPEKILHLGDSKRHDIAGARAAGWQSRLIATGAGLSTFLP